MHDLFLDRQDERIDPMRPYFKEKLFQPPVVQAEVADIWANRGFTCYLYVDPPGQEWNDFVHRTNELVTVINGQLNLLAERKNFVLNVGDEVFIPYGVRHSVKNTSSENTSWLFGYDDF